MAAADVVIVGSGPAGCGAAARLLAEGRRVTMLEAGPGPERPAAVTSLDALAAAATPGWTWPGVHWRRAGADRGPYAIGRGVGGGSAVNAMVLTVGDPAMHDAWAARTGDDGWAWAAFDDAYQRILAQLPATTLEAGPLGQAVALAAEHTAGSGVTPVGARGAAGGRPSTLAEGATGVLAATVAADAGQRLPLVDVVCAADGGGRHPHLDVQCNRQVRRVMAGVDGAVVGVETDDGDRVTAPAVVLAAGALHSPALAETGRPPRWVGPVAGEGPRPVMDHPSFAFTVALRPEARVDPSPRPPVSIVVRCGPQGGLDGPTSVLVHVLDHVGPGEEGRRHGAVVVALAEPSSVGTVEPGPDGAMLIEPAWLDDAGDREAMVAAARLVASWLGDPAVAAVAEGVMLDDQGSDLSAIEGWSDEELGRWLVAHPGPVRHPTSTMSSLLAPGGPGADDDPGYARGLLVADGSVLPTVPTVDPQLPIMANAWRLAGRLAET